MHRASRVLVRDSSIAVPCAVDVLLPSRSPFPLSRAAGEGRGEGTLVEALRTLALTLPSPASGRGEKPSTMSRMDTPQTAFLFDLDGTLVDSVYQHVLAWQDALESAGMPLSAWGINRGVAMSGGLMTNILLGESGHAMDDGRGERQRRTHAEAYNRRSKAIRPLPGARELVKCL